MKKLTPALTAIIFILSSCADSKEFVINNEKVTIEPYGWFDLEAKHDSIRYKVCTGNIVLSFIFCETIIVPIVLTGDELYEPVSKK